MKGVSKGEREGGREAEKEILEALCVYTDVN